MPRILVTGANRGLGLEFARQYAADGWDEVVRAVEEAQIVAFKPVGDQKDRRAGCRKPPQPDLVEPFQRCPDARAAFPIANLRADMRFTNNINRMQTYILQPEQRLREFLYP